MNARQQVGMAGERFVQAYLEASLGWELITTNWRCRAGEIDIVAKEQDCLVVVEVRTRQTTVPGIVIESIPGTKLRQLYRVLRHFLAEYASVPPYQSIRVDAVAVRLDSGLVAELIHVRHALVLDDVLTER